MQQNNVVFTDSILVNLDGVLAILLSVAFLYCVAGQFARLAAEHNASAETQGESRRHNEAARLDAYDFGDALVLVQIVHLVADFLQTLVVLE